MSSAKAATEFLSGFRSGASADDPLVKRILSNSSDLGDPMERLGKILADAGEDGLALDEVQKGSGLSLVDFYSALALASKLNMLESFEVDGTNKLRLTPSAMNLY